MSFRTDVRNLVFKFIEKSRLLAALGVTVYFALTFLMMPSLSWSSEEDPFQVPGTGEAEVAPAPNAPPATTVLKRERKRIYLDEGKSKRTLEPSSESGEEKPSEAPKEEKKPKPLPETSEDVVLVDDFNGGVRSNLLGGAMGSWLKDDADETQGCEIDFVERPHLGKSGYSMSITYDVDSPNQAYNGVWIKLEGFDARPYKFLVLYLKAPNQPPYGTDTLKLEIRNDKKESGSYIIKRIPRGAWREYKIPLSKFHGIKDWSTLDELVIVFEDKLANPKEGIIYLENIYFTKGEIRRPS